MVSIAQQAASLGNWEKPPERLTKRYDTWVPKNARLKQVDKYMLDVGEERNTAQVVADLGASLSSIWNALRRLEREGRVEKLRTDKHGKTIVSVWKHKGN